jgi:hypothetical protein
MLIIGQRELENKQMTYSIIRFYAKMGKRPKVIARGLTLEHAQAHCQDPKTQNMKGPFNSQWFDGYERD